jgi:inositol transport system ATP-binding protein
MDELLTVSHVSKTFSGIKALEDVHLEIRQGEVHALVGENGAGKSTLMKILIGLYRPDQGAIRYRGHPLQWNAPHEALRAGLAMIHQELLPFREMTVAENIAMGREPTRRIPGWLDKTTLHRQAKQWLQRLGADLAPTRKMKDLRVAEVQTVEIAKALACEAQLIIMDEPTSALSEREIQRLLEVIGDLKRLGVAVIYISHKLEEIFRIADRVTVLRDGHHVTTETTGALDESRLIRLMVGRDIPAAIRKPPAAKGPEVLTVDRLSRPGCFYDISFRLHAGEIVGIAGLMGAGRTEVVHAIFGLEPASSGEIIVQGRRKKIRNPGDAMASGIALVTEDRKGSGLIPALSVKHNLTLSNLRHYCRFGGFIDRYREEQAAQEQCRNFSIRSSGLDQGVRFLSGGNQQKVVLAKALLTDPAILILDEPTRGIDVGAKAEIYELITSLARKGKAILMVSSELSEILSLSDRILVMRQGILSAAMDAHAATQEEILRHAMPIGG